MAITFKWGGTAIAGSRSSSAVWTVQDYEFGPLVFEPRVQELRILHGERENWSPMPVARRDWRLTIKIDASAVVGTTPTDESRVLDAWEEAASFFDPYGGTAKLEVTRPDTDAANVVRHLYANVLEIDQPRIIHHDPQGVGGSGAYPVSTMPYAIFVVRGDTRFPWWTRASLLTTDTAPAAAELAVSGSTDTVTINNPGDRWVGCKFNVKAASVSGTVNGFTLTNTTNGDVLKITKSTAMAAAEYVDWLAVDPRTVDKTAAWKFGTGDNRMRLEPGNNTIEVARTGAGTGTLTLELSWPSLHYTF